MSAENSAARAPSACRRHRFVRLSGRALAGTSVAHTCTGDPGFWRAELERGAPASGPREDRRVAMATLTVTRDEKKEMKPVLREMEPFFSNPFRLMNRFSDEMDRMFEHFGFRPRLFEPLPSTALWAPDIEIVEKPNQLLVRADLPGLTKDDVKVNLTDDLLTLEGERKEEKETKREGYYRSERNYGAFYRSIPLPEGVRTDKVDATFKNGVLEVTLPWMKEEKKAKTVDIKAA
jgi:HSP20 family protein